MGASALAAALLLPACGAGGGGSEAARPEPAVDLRIQFWADRSRTDGVSATLTCDPVGGTHPRAEEACAALAAHPEALEPVPADAACTQIYGGDETAEVTGLVAGRQIEASFSRKNGCEISRWEALAPLLQL
ncbi:MAG: SSI family serine proteinase inhibitor [Gaiellaceae bacterium]